MLTPRRDREAWAQDMNEKRAIFDQASAELVAATPVTGIQAMLEILPNIPDQLTIYDQPGTAEIVARFAD